MLNRHHCKQVAREQLRGRYRTPMLMALVFIVVNFLVSLPDAIRILKIYEEQGLVGLDLIRAARATGSNHFALLLIVMNAFIFGTIEIAQCHVYTTMFKTTEKIPFGTFVASLSDFLRGTLAFLWQTLWVSIWLMLFFIPGIVKLISYSEMFFILAEYPQMEVRKAMNLSKVITNGYKSDLFSMALSFLGWHLLAIPTGGLLYLWLLPYQKMSFTNAYQALKARAIQTGILSEKDFSGESVSDESVSDESVSDESVSDESTETSEPNEVF